MRRIKPRERSNIQFHPPYCNEINELYHAFNHLLERTDQLLSEVATRKELQKVAELKALQAQMNPHYIYNTLDSVGWLALKRKQGDIADIVSLLADIIRYSIKNYGQMVLLSDEITHIENYMSIQFFRFGTKTSRIFDIPKKYYRIKIPKLTRQQLSENSLLHGFA
ncbi:MAG: sensor histidine kinase, partial [Salinispira sp.]